MNNENIYINKNEKRAQEQSTQQPWTRRMFNWMYSNEAARSQDLIDDKTIDQYLDEDEEDDYLTETTDAPLITINSPSSLDASTEFSSTRLLVYFIIRLN